MSAFQTALDRLTAALDALEGNVARGGRPTGDSGADVEKLEAERSALQKALAEAEAREQQLARRASEASEELDAAITEVKTMLEG